MASMGARIRKAREALGLSREMLAVRVGVSYWTVAKCAEQVVLGNPLLQGEAVEPFGLHPLEAHHGVSPKTGDSRPMHRFLYGFGNRPTGRGGSILRRP